MSVRLTYGDSGPGWTAGGWHFGKSRQEGRGRGPKPRRETSCTGNRARTRATLSSASRCDRIGTGPWNRGSPGLGSSSSRPLAWREKGPTGVFCPAPPCPQPTDGQTEARAGRRDERHGSWKSPLKCPTHHHREGPTWLARPRPREHSESPRSPAGEEHGSPNIAHLLRPLLASLPTAWPPPHPDTHTAPSAGRGAPPASTHFAVPPEGGKGMAWRPGRRETPVSPHQRPRSALWIQTQGREPHLREPPAASTGGTVEKKEARLCSAPGQVRGQQRLQTAPARAKCKVTVSREGHSAAGTHLRSL